MFDLKPVYCKGCRKNVGYSDADYVPLILCASCASEAQQ